MFDTEQIRDLIQGKLKYKKCPNCDNTGTVYWDMTSGLGESPIPTSINKEDLDWGSCPKCNGLGYLLFY